jgi:hypothetical protein
MSDGRDDLLQTRPRFHERDTDSYGGSDLEDLSNLITRIPSSPMPKLDQHGWSWFCFIAIPLIKVVHAEDKVTKRSEIMDLMFKVR